MTSAPLRLPTARLIAVTVALALADVAPASSAQPAAAPPPAWVREPEKRPHPVPSWIAHPQLRRARSSEPTPAPESADGGEEASGRPAR